MHHARDSGFANERQEHGEGVGRRGEGPGDGESVTPSQGGVGRRDLCPERHDLGLETALTDDLLEEGSPFPSGLDEPPKMAAGRYRKRDARQTGSGTDVDAPSSGKRSQEREDAQAVVDVALPNAAEVCSGDETEARGMLEEQLHVPGQPLVVNHGTRPDLGFRAFQRPSRARLARLDRPSDDDLPGRLLPLTEAGGPFDLGDGIVDDLALVGAHGFELDLGAPLLRPAGHGDRVLGER